MKKLLLYISFLIVCFIAPSFVWAQNVPAPQSLVVSLTGYRDAQNALKCKLYYMVTLPSDPSVIENIHLILEKPLDEGGFEVISDLIVPFDWTKAQQTEGVVSFYTTRNLLYIGIGEFDLLRQYQCKIAFLDELGQKSRYAIYKK